MSAMDDWTKLATAQRDALTAAVAGHPTPGWNFSHGPLGIAHDAAGDTVRAEHNFPDIESVPEPTWGDDQQTAENDELLDIEVEAIRGDTRAMSDAEWAQVSANILSTADAYERALDPVTENDELVDAAGEPRDPDPYVAALQDDRDRCAARGDFERAEDINAQVQDLRHPTLEVPAQRTTEPVTLNDVDRVVAQEHLDRQDHDRQDHDRARLGNARDREAAGGRFDGADASQRLIDHLQAARANIQAVQAARLPTAARSREVGLGVGGGVERA